MFFWIVLPIVFVAFLVAFVWGLRGFSQRTHEPGTQYMFRKDR